MACIPLPKVAAPSLPAPLTIAPSLPTLSFDDELCCKILPFAAATPPVPLPPGTINPAVIAIVTNAMSQVQAYLNSLSIPCPKE